MTAEAVTLAIVDDDPDDIFPIKKSVSRIEREITLLEFLSGQSILSYLEDAASSYPDLLLLDINMPRMNGFEVLRQLKSDNRWAHIPVVILTTSSHAVDRARCLEAGAQDVVTKFASLKAIDEWLSTLVSSSGDELHQ